MTETAELRSWRDTATRRALEGFVESVVSGPGAVREAERVAVRSDLAWLGAAIDTHDDEDDTDRGDATLDAGAEHALAAAAENGYTVASVRDDGDAMFPDSTPSPRRA